MSKHWQPPGRHTIGAREILLMLAGGLALGLGAATITSPPRSSAPSVADEEAWRQVKPRDPWAESRRSRALLDGQEGAPGGVDRGQAPARRSASAPAAVRIVDGDTFWYGGEKIRIADIDTPEIRGRCPYETQLAARATARMAALLAAGPFELVPIDRDQDQYGRKLRVVVRGGRSLGDQLVNEGLARTWSGRREPWCA